MTCWLIVYHLDSTHERLIKATITDLIYDEVRDDLIKVFA